jgi:hypothetical protein
VMGVYLHFQQLVNDVKGGQIVDNYNKLTDR